MKNILIIGATGQIGTELTMRLRKEYGESNVVAGYIKGAEPQGVLAESGPSAEVDITNAQQIADAVEKYNIDTIYNLAALLSATAEAKPQLAWKIGVGGLYNTLEVAREKKLCRIYPQLDRLFWQRYSSRQNSTRYHTTPRNNLRHYQSYG
jgi:dTDP-4-dehydrorhamnose reductase